jgi:hypothetical protein
MKDVIQIGEKYFFFDEKTKKIEPIKTPSKANEAKKRGLIKVVELTEEESKKIMEEINKKKEEETAKATKKAEAEAAKSNKKTKK